MLSPFARPGVSETVRTTVTLPWLSLDVVFLRFAAGGFSAMDPGAVLDFGALRPFGYAIVPLTGFVLGGRAPA